MKVLRYLVLAILAIVALLAVVIVVATFVIDPNTYKPQIEKLVESKTRLDLTLAGDIDWSLIPLGLTLNDVSAELDGEPLASLDTLVAEVDFWSLLQFEPAVNTFILEGLSANLVRNAEGQGNWERIMPQTADAPTGGTAAEPAPAETPTEAPAETAQPGQESQPLQFAIEEVRVADAQLHYSDEATGQTLTLDQVDLTAQDITLGSSFPLNLSFHFATNQPELDVNGTVAATMTASEDLQQFSISGLDSNFEITGEPLGGETAEAAFSGDISADLAAETATISNLEAQLANLVLRSNLSVEGFAEPQLSGSLTVEPFSARELLDSLGLPPIETQDPAVLQNIALKTDIAGPPGQIELNNFVLTLDDTTFTGNLQYGLANGFIGVDLQGDRLNLDRYLPPAAEEEAETAGTGDGTQETPAPSAPATGTTGNAGAGAPESDLLPLETLRGLALDINLGLDELIASKLTINDIGVRVTGEGGLIQLEAVEGKMYDGSFLLTGQLDARTDTPQWHISQTLNNIQTLPLLTDLADVKIVSGGVNLEADITTQGNRISALRENASGEASFAIADGAFETINLKAIACEGIALVNGETIDTSGWPQRTTFQDLSGNMQIDGNTLINNDLSAALGGLDLSGQGTIDLAQTLLDYEAGLRVVGDIHKDEACRVNPRVQDIVIPVECRGNFATDPASLCSFDGSRFRETLKDMAEAELRRKATEKIDEKLDDILGEDKDGQEGGARDQLRDAIKGLFN